MCLGLSDARKELFLQAGTSNGERKKTSCESQLRLSRLVGKVWSNLEKDEEEGRKSDIKWKRGDIWGRKECCFTVCES